MKRVPLHHLRRPLRSAEPTAAQLYQARAAVYQAVAPLCLQSDALDPRERQRLAGNLFPECDAVVREIAGGLRQFPDRLRDVPVDGAQLAAAQAQASAALRLHRCLRYLAELAFDHYVSRQAACAAAAVAVVRQVEHPAPFEAIASHVAREDALGHALVALRRQRERARRALRERRALDAAARAAPAQAPRPGADEP